MTIPSDDELVKFLEKEQKFCADRGQNIRAEKFASVIVVLRTERTVSAAEAARVKLALGVAVGMLAPNQPGDSRAVDDWFVACAAVKCGLDDTDGRITECLNTTLRALAGDPA